MDDDPISERLTADAAELKLQRARLRRQQIERSQNHAEGRPRCIDSNNHDPLLEALKQHHGQK